MPRNASGTYALPSPPNPVVTGTPITSDWANTTMNDIATALTDSLSRTGQGGMIGPFKVIDGTVAEPGLSFISQPATGLYRSANGGVGVAIQGVQRALLSAEGLEVSGDINATNNFTALVNNTGSGGSGYWVETDNGYGDGYAKMQYEGGQFAVVVPGPNGINNWQIDPTTGTHTWYVDGGIAATLTTDTFTVAKAAFSGDVTVGSLGVDAGINVGGEINVGGQINGEGNIVIDKAGTAGAVVQLSNDNGGIRLDYGSNGNFQLLDAAGAVVFTGMTIGTNGTTVIKSSGPGQVNVNAFGASVTGVMVATASFISSDSNTSTSPVLGWNGQGLAGWANYSTTGVISANTARGTSGNASRSSAGVYVITTSVPVPVGAVINATVTGSTPRFITATRPGPHQITVRTDTAGSTQNAIDTAFCLSWYGGS